MKNGGTGKSSRTDQELKRRPVLDQRKKELMMAIIIRNKEAFTAVREQLRVETFGGFDQGYAVTWKLVCDFYDSHDRLPDFELLMAEVEAAVAAQPDLLNDVEFEALSKFFSMAFDQDNFGRPIEDDQVYAHWAIRNCKLFLEETLKSRVAEMVQTPHAVPLDMPTVLGELAWEAENISTMAVRRSEEAFPDDWDKSAGVNPFSTGIPFIDHFLGGGHAAGEVYGLMGPYASCKTTLAVMLAVNASRKFWEKAKEKPEEPPLLSFYFSYEAPLRELRRRVMGFAAKIHRDTIDPMTDMLAEFSRVGSLKDYEKRLFVDTLRDGDEPPGEYDRMMMVRPRLNQHLMLIDMTGTTQKGLGNGYVREIASIVAAECRARKAKCGSVVLDYVGAMAKRHMEAEDIPMSELRHYIGGAPLKLSNNIAGPFNCPLWALHQLAGEVNSRSSAVEPHHTDAAEAKSFGENLDFCCCVGVPDKKLRAALFGCTKARRQPPRQSTIIEIDGGLNRVLWGNEKYVLNSRLRRIMLRDDVAMLPDSMQGSEEDNSHLGLVD